MGLHDTCCASWCWGTVLVTIGLTCVIWLTQSLRFVDMIVNRGLSAETFFYLIMLLVPNFLSVIMPVALFTVVVFTYSKLISDRELVVMRSAGLSQFAIAKPALILASFVVALGYALNVYLIPQSYKAFRELQWDIRYSYSHIVLLEGTFNSVTRDVTVYVRERTKDGQLKGILVHDDRNKDKPSTIMASRGALVETAGISRVVMFDGNRQEVEKITNKSSILYFDRYTFDLGKTKEEVTVRYREPRERTLHELFNVKQDKQLNVKDLGRFTVEAHKRLVSPLFAACFTLIGLTCLISGSITRRGQTRRIVLAATIVTFFVAMAMSLESISAKRLELIPLMYANPVLTVVISYVLMLRFPKRRRSGALTGLAAGAS